VSSLEMRSSIVKTPFYLRVREAGKTARSASGRSGPAFAAAA
jgi:hypothetical protein